MSNEEAKKTLDYLANRCGYYRIALNYIVGMLKWRPYVRSMAGTYDILYSWSEDNGCRYISIIGSGHSYAECLMTMLKETSKGCDIKINNWLNCLNFPNDMRDKVFLKRGMTEDMLLIEMDLESLRD